MTAAATTGPKSDPRPTSSTPATSSVPDSHARFSNLRVQRSFFNRRSLAAEAEMPFNVFEEDADLERDLDTALAQHLRRSDRAKQEEMCSKVVWLRSFACLDGAKPRPHTRTAGLAYCCSTSFSRAAFPLS